MQRFIPTGIIQITIIGCYSSLAHAQDITTLRAQIRQEATRLAAEWQYKQANNLKTKTSEYPKTSSEEIQREVARGAEYVISRIQNKQPVFVLTSEIEFYQLRDSVTALSHDQVNITRPTHSEFHLPFETYDGGPNSSATKSYERIGREIALHWFYSRQIFPVNILQ